MRKRYVSLFFALLFILVPVLASAAETFSVSVPAGTEVTMQDANAVLPFTVTNNAGSTRDIRRITFTFDTAKYEVSSATVPPTGWCVREVAADSITFALLQSGGSCSAGSTSNEIAPGGSKVFNITILPLASGADVSGDSPADVTVDTQGGFSMTGALPTWTRRALEATMSATPDSTGVGSTITLTMQVTNRSTVTQAGITTSPAPPSASSAIVTNTEGPYYGSTALSGDHTASATIITAGSTSEFASTGTIKIDSEEICYTGTTATTFTGVTRGCNGTTASAHTSGATVYELSAFSLASGETRTVTWKYSADITGSVYFSARASNSGGTANSVSVSSNTVIIGSFTAAISLSPESVISGQRVTVQMTVKNNGSSALINVAPSALTGCAGGASETLFLGPSPSSISSLASGNSGAFTWTYTITGSVGQAYCISGYATANGGFSTNTSTSNSGTVSQYSATVSPSVVSSGSTNKTLTWTVYNGGACTLRRVTINTPASGGNWTCSSVTPPSGWSASCGATIRFSSSNVSNDIPSGGTKSYSITFSTTETVTSDKVVEFTVLPGPRGGCGGSEGTIGTYVTVTAYGITLAHSPAGPIYADGSSTYTMTATLATGGSPVSGKTITFSATTGTLSSSTAATDANGQATVTLTAPNSTTDTTATVTATYLNASNTDTLNFTGWNKASLQYWGSLSPTSVSCGVSYTFTMQVKNISTTTSMTPSTASYFAFNDYSEGGSSVYQAYLDSSVAVAPGATVSLSFGSATSAGGGGGVTVPTSLIAGTYQPTQNSTPPPASGLFFTDGGTNDQYRTVTDNVTVSGTNCGTVRVNIIEWHELR